MATYERDCRVCNTPFTATSHLTRFCSPECKTIQIKSDYKAKNARHRAKRKKLEEETQRREAMNIPINPFFLERGDTSYSGTGADVIMGMFA